MGCAVSMPSDEAVRKCLRQLPARLVPDLETLTLRDPGARRAVSDFVKADKNGSGHLSADDFSSYFGLDGDLFLGRVVATMDGRLVDGNIDLVEFLNGIACFAASSKEEKDVRIRVFAFQMMDLRHEGHIHIDHLKRFATLAYEQFAGSSSSEWGDTGKSMKSAKNLAAVHKAIDRFCSDSEDITFPQFERLAAELPLVIAPAHFTWTAFELISPSCKVLCAAMALRGHREFLPRKTGFRERSKPLVELKLERMPPAQSQESAKPVGRVKTQPAPLERTFSREVNPPETPPELPDAHRREGAGTAHGGGARPSAPAGGWPEGKPARLAQQPGPRPPSPLSAADEPRRLKPNTSRVHEEMLRQEVVAHLEVVESRPAGMSRLQASKQKNAAL